jgi:hypothetical protein
MSILDDSAIKQNSSAFNNEQVEAIKGTLDAMKLAAFFAALPGVYGAITLFKLMIKGLFTLDIFMLFILAAAYATAGITTFMASRALTTFSYNPNTQDFEDANNSLKIAWFAWAVWAIIASFYAIYYLMKLLG